MTVRAVHWHEGMFLWPQQLQLAERYRLQQLHRQHNWNLHYDWGLRSLDFDPEALAQGRFIVREMRARLRDGTAISVPDDAPLPPLDLKAEFDRESSVTIHVAVPKLHPGKANAIDRKYATDPKAGDSNPGAPGSAKPGEQATAVRYLIDSQDLEDENTGEGAQAIQVRLLNLRLMTSNQDLTGYEVLPIARLHRPEGQAEGCALDETYIPPVLACDAWKPLRNGILQEIFDRFGRRVNLLGRQVVSRGISFDTRNPGDGLLLGQLHALNQGYSLLGTLAFADGVHPLTAYLDLCRYAGQLAVFTDSRKAPELPRYDHDDLGGCFYRVKQFLDSIDINEPTYEERPFLVKGKRIEVTMEPKWLEPKWEMFVGVTSNLTQDECIRLMTRPGVLDMKIGSGETVDAIFEKGRMGLEFTPTATPPRSLPVQPGLVYFQVNRATKIEEWQNVQKSRTLALRVNENRVMGAVEGQHEIMIRAGGEPRPIRFTLFLTPKDAG